LKVGALSSSLSPSQQNTSLPISPSLRLESSFSITAASSGAIQDEVEGAPRDNFLDDSAYLALLVHPLGGSIPESLFVQAKSPQLRWSEHGVLREMTALDTGLDQQLNDILSDESRINRALTSLVKSAGMNGPSTYSLDSQSEDRLSQILENEGNDKWPIKTLGLVGFVFPQRVL
jgi:hypothetical protein